MKKVIDRLQNVADLCYSGNIARGIAQMQQVIPDIQGYLVSVTSIEIQERLVKDALVPMLSAMEQEDGIELADRITYELIPILKSN